VKLGIDVTNRLLARYVVVLPLAEDQSGYVASILSRRARLLGLMWDLDKTPLLCRVTTMSPVRNGWGCGSW
jgi:hypothetical protein